MRTFIATLFVALSYLAFGQDYSFTRLSEEDGLPGSHMNCFVKDDRGFMWMGTGSGLYRYDGYTIKSYASDQGYNISDDYITAIIQDKDRMIWVGTNGGGLNRFDPSTETFATFRHNPEDPLSIAGERIRKLAEGEGVIWVAFDNGLGLSKLDKKTGKSVNYDPFQSIKVPGVKAIRGMVLDEYNANTLWLGTTSGLIRFDIENESFQVIDHPLSKSNHHGLFALEQIDENRLICGFFSAGIDIYHMKEEEWSNVYTIYSKKLRIFDLARKSETEFWVSARKRGLAIYNIDRNEFNYVHSDLDNPSTPFPGFTYSVYSDNDRVWVGGKYGVSYSHKDRPLFPFDSISFSDTRFGKVTAISGKYDKVYMVGLMLQGIVEIDKASNERSFHSFNGESPNLHGMLEREQVIYLYNEKSELFVFDKTTKSLRQINIPLHKGKKIPIRGIHDWTSNHAIILNAYGMAFKLNYQTNELSTLVDTDEWQMDALVLEDSSVWIGGSKGVTVFDPKNNNASRINLRSISNEKEQHIQALAKGKDGVVWVGTTRGLIKLADNEETLYNVNNSDLTGNFISQVMIDLDGNIWLNNQKGFSKVIPSRMEVTSYDHSDGIDPEGILAMVDGKIYYGTYGGYFKVATSAIKKTHKSPSVHLLSFQVANQEFQLEKNIDYTKDIQLEYWENSFSFSFSTPSYDKSNKVQYAYQLIGQDDDWIISKKRRFASYTNLSGGQYTFQVKAKTRESDWGEVKSINIYVATPFWETRWFYTLITFLIFLAGFIIYKLRIRAVQRKADMEAQELQIEALKNRFMELHTSPSQLVVQLKFEELNQKLNNHLTEREFEALKLSLEGKTNAEISDLLFISISTVKFHLRNTYSKMGVSNRKEAFQFMLKTS